MKTLRAIGFWRVPHYEWSAESRVHVFSGWTSEFKAYPQAILAALGPSIPDSRVVSYLRDAQVVNEYRGLSHCRFECGISNREMGFRDQSDGEWLWPEGLAHYVEKHQLPLPEEFLETVTRSHGHPPAFDLNTDIAFDTGFWETWFASVTANIANR